MPETVPWYQSKRLLAFGVMVVARVVPMIWHSPEVKQLCDWILDMAMGSGGVLAVTSSRRITLRRKPKAEPVV